MSILDKLPILDRCCGCVTDIKAATAIIAVLGIVTSPVVSWAIVRHAYVVRISCAITTNATNPDIVDINLNNALSFGFGANAGLGMSCLSKTGTADADNNTISTFVQLVKFSGWIVLFADVAFLITSTNLIARLYKGNDKRASQAFLISGVVSVLLTFLYGILYVAACLYVGGNFPVLELLFAFIDLITWMHFLCVVYSYNKLSTLALDNKRLPVAVSMIIGFFIIFGFLIWIYYLMVVFSYRRRSP